MGTNSNQQGSNQQSSNKNNSKSPGKKQLTGAIEALKGNVYSLSSNQQINQYEKITEAISTYVIQTFGKPLGKLILGEEEPPMKPTEPTTTKDKDGNDVAPSAVDQKIFDKQIDRFVIQLET